MKQRACLGRIAAQTVLIGSLLLAASAAFAEDDPLAARNFYRALSGRNDGECSGEALVQTFGQGMLTGMVRTWAWSGWLSRPLRAEQFFAMIKTDVDQHPEKLDADIFEVSFDALNSRGYISAAGYSAFAAKITDEVMRELEQGNK